MMHLEKLPGHIKGEKIQLFLRRHWYVFAVAVFIYILLLVLPPIFYMVVVQGADLQLSEVMQAAVLLLMSAYYLFVWMFFFNTIVDHYLDIWIVTNRRILNIEQEGLFSRTIAEQKLERIQDVTSEVKGLIPTFLNFGNVIIQTAGATVRFIFKDIPNPTNVANKILKVLEQNTSKKENPVLKKKGVIEAIKDALLD